VPCVISQGLALKYTTASGHNICDIRAHNVMFAPQSPHFRLDLNMEQKFPPYGPCWSSTMFINKHMWIHHKTVILSLCIMRLKTSGSCLYGAHIYPSSCARLPDQFTLIRLFYSSCYAMIRRSQILKRLKKTLQKKLIVAKQREQKMQTRFVSPIHKKKLKLNTKHFSFSF
jgi:hypothetical protein